MKVEIYSDIACPWCYIGERRFKRALAAYPQADDVEVVFRSYQLDPGAPEEAVPLPDYLQRRFGQPVDGMLQQVTDAGKGEGIEFDWDRALSVNTLTAHRLLHLAEHEYGAETQRALAERLFEAYFSRGGDMTDHALLTELAVAVGMNEERVRGYLASDEGLAETRGEIDRARALGITAVPTFVFEGKFAVQGAQSASTFLQALEQVAEQTRAAAAENGNTADDEGAAGDACADGSCAV